jgi:hypothetical protein
VCRTVATSFSHTTLCSRHTVLADQWRTLGLTHEDLLFKGCAGTRVDVKLLQDQVRCCDAARQSARWRLDDRGVRVANVLRALRNPPCYQMLGPLACVCIPA